MYRFTLAKIGKRVPETLAALELLGCASSWNVARLLPCIEPTNVGKYLSRAVGLGLATVDRSNGTARFACVPGWRESLALRNGDLPAAKAADDSLEGGKLYAARVGRWPNPAYANFAPPTWPFAKGVEVLPAKGVFVRAQPVLPDLDDLHPLYSVWR